MAALFAVVGPSGVGKDTLMAAVQARYPQIHLVRRVITRPAAAGGEEFESVSPEEFDRRRTAGDFVLHWRAHGLSYGIPATVRGLLDAGRPVLFNGSRAALTEAATAFPALKVIHVTARPEVLRDRLRARGRETDAQIEERLAGRKIPLPVGLEVYELDNSADLDAAVEGMIAILKRAGALPPAAGAGPGGAPA